jgi:hypothetical protein
MKHARKVGMLLLLLLMGNAASSAKEKDALEGESINSEYTAEKLTHDKFDNLEGAAWHDLNFSLNDAERKDTKSS